MYVRRYLHVFARVCAFVRLPPEIHVRTYSSARAYGVLLGSVANLKGWPRIFLLFG